MDPYTAAIIGSTAISIFGNAKANRAEAEAERQNEAWMREQAEWIKKTTKRETEIYNKDSLDSLAATANAYAKSNIGLEGSALAVKQQEEMIRMKELNAIRDQGDMQLREAYLKIGASKTKQAALTSSFNNFAQGLAIGVQGGMQARQTYKAEK